MRQQPSRVSTLHQQPSREECTSRLRMTTRAQNRYMRENCRITMSIDWSPCAKTGPCDKTGKIPKPVHAPLIPIPRVSRPPTSGMFAPPTPILRPFHGKIGDAPGATFPRTVSRQTAATVSGPALGGQGASMVRMRSILHVVWARRVQTVGHCRGCVSSIRQTSLCDAAHFGFILLGRYLVEFKYIAAFSAATSEFARSAPRFVAGPFQPPQPYSRYRAPGPIAALRARSQP